YRLVPTALMAVLNRLLGALEQPVFENHVKSAQTIFPADLFPFRVSSGVICDRNFIDSAAKFGKLCDQFRIDAKSVLMNGYPSNQRCPEYFVPGLYVGQPQTGKDVGEAGSKLVAGSLPEIPELLQLSACETRTQNDIRFVSEDRSQQTGILSWIVLKVSILNHDYIPRRRSETCPESRALAKISWLENDTIYRRTNLFQNGPRVVIRTI